MEYSLDGLKGELNKMILRMKEMEAKEMFDTGVDTASGMASDAYDQAKEYGEEGMEMGRDAYDQAEQYGKEGMEMGRDAYGKAKDYTDEMGESISDSYSEMAGPTDTLNKAKYAGRKALHSGEVMMDDAGQAVGDGYEAAMEYLRRQREGK